MNAVQRPQAATPAQTIAFKTMIHSIQTGKALKTALDIASFTALIARLEGEG